MQIKFFDYNLIKSSFMPQVIKKNDQSICLLTLTNQIQNIYRLEFPISSLLIELYNL